MSSQAEMQNPTNLRNNRRPQIPSDNFYPHHQEMRRQKPQADNFNPFGPEMRQHQFE